jgi:hypothetical protein
MSSGNLCAVERLSDTHFVEATINNSSGAVTLRIGSVSGVTVTMGADAAPFTVNGDEAWSLAVTPDKSKIVVMGASNAFTITAKSYTWSGTTLTLDDTDTFTVSSYAIETRHALVALTNTRMIAMLPTTTSGRKQAVGITLGSGSIAFDATGTQVNNTVSDNPAPRPSKLVRISDTTCYGVATDGVGAQSGIFHLTDGAPIVVNTNLALDGNSSDPARYLAAYSPLAGRLITGWANRNLGDRKYSNVMRSVTVSGATITLPANYPLSGGCPHSPWGLKLFQDSAVSPSLILSIGNGVPYADVVKAAGVQFAEVDPVSNGVRYGIPLANPNAVTTNSLLASDAVMLTNSLGVQVYAGTSNYPNVCAFSL